MRRLRRLLGRAALDDEEVQMLLGIARQMTWAGAQARGRIRN
jgi:tRNA C32,U32 (ribose-2'-O)-methylase TrmJ